MKKKSICLATLLSFSLSLSSMTILNPVNVLALSSENVSSQEIQSTPAPTLQPKYTINPLGILDGNSSKVCDINDSNQAVGYAYQGRNGPYHHAFIYENGQIKDLASFLGTNSYAYAINNDGNIAGEADNRAYMLDSSKRKTSIKTLGGDWSSAIAINDANQIAGNSYDSLGATHAFFWSRGHLVDIGTLGNANSYATMMNQNGQVIGNLVSTDGITRGFIYENGKTKDIGTLGGKNTYVAYINDDGKIVGNSETATGATHAFLYNNGKIKDLGTLGGNNSDATCINEDGEIIGTADSATATLPVIYKNNKFTVLSGFASTDRVFPSYISNTGLILGSFKTSLSQVSHLFVLNRGNLTDVGNLGYFTEALKVNKHGIIIGNGHSHVGGFGEAYEIIKN